MKFFVSALMLFLGGCALLPPQENVVYSPLLGNAPMVTESVDQPQERVEVVQSEFTIVPVDSFGNIQWHKERLTVTRDGRIIPTDSFGNRLYHRGGQVIRK